MSPSDLARIDLARVARSIRDRLEVDRLFGWSVPLRRSRIAPRPGSAEARVSTPLARPVSPERAAREALLLPVREEVAACARCALCHSRTQTVFGVGDPMARLLFVGEAPGFDEDRLGEPFVGAAGKLLDDIIRAMGLRRSEVYIANIVKCRPPQNRVPNPAEAGACIGYLERQIEIVAPEVIVALGSVAAKNLLRSEAPIGKLRGRFHAYHGIPGGIPAGIPGSIPVMATYHPAYLLRNPEEKRKVWEDIQLVMARLGLKRQ